MSLGTMKIFMWMSVVLSAAIAVFAIYMYTAGECIRPAAQVSLWAGFGINAVNALTFRNHIRRAGSRRSDNR